MPTRRKDLAQTIDEAWLDELRSRLDAKGAKLSLAKSLKVEPSQISKLVKGTHAPAHLVIATSRQLGMSLPSSWFDEREARILRALRQVEDVIEQAPDAKRRAAGEQLLDAVTDDLEENVRALRDHLGALLRASDRQRFDDEGN